MEFCRTSVLQALSNIAAAEQIGQSSLRDEAVEATVPFRWESGLLNEGAIVSELKIVNVWPMREA